MWQNSALVRLPDWVLFDLDMSNATEFRDQSSKSYICV